MVSTRSKTKQSKIEDYTNEKSTSKHRDTSEQTRSSSPPQANISRKRKAVDTKSSEQKSPAKRAKTTKESKTADSASDDAASDIVINRSPVLQLWAACVAHSIYPQVEWETCLSAGSVISSICAVSKGRSIGTIADKSGASKEQKKKKKDETNEEETQELDVLEVMHFSLPLKDGRALVSSSDSKGKPGSEELLKKKFGEEQYEKTRETFETALKTWEGDEGELNKQAFGFYEDFRPSVKSGQKGWGRKGTLSLDQVRDVVAR